MGSYKGLCDHFDESYLIAEKFGLDTSPESLVTIVKMLQYQQRNSEIKHFVDSFKNAHVVNGNSGPSALEKIAMVLRDKDHLDITINEL